MSGYCEVEWIGNRWYVNYDGCPPGEKCDVDSLPPGWFIGQIIIVLCVPK